jgi:hypothetical protein
MIKSSGDTMAEPLWDVAALAEFLGRPVSWVYDEAWRVTRHVALPERMQPQRKLSRGPGIANMTVIHRLSDQLTAAASLLGLIGVETRAVGALTKGRGLWKVAGHSFIIQHLLHPAERDLFGTGARMHAKVREFTNTDVLIPLNRRVVGR